MVAFGPLYHSPPNGSVSEIKSTPRRSLRACELHKRVESWSLRPFISHCHCGVESKNDTIGPCEGLGNHR
jgi:hypothetical protein